MFENVRLALGSLRANKMRALLTMLGIIIGIGSVIAIMTVGESLTGSLNDSMSGLGASNLTVSLTQKSSDDESAGGARVRMFAPSTPGADDLMTDEMIAEYRAAFGSMVGAIELTESLGSGTVESAAGSATVTATGVNEEYYLTEELELLYGRLPADSDGGRRVALVSDQFVEDAFGGTVSAVNAVGQSFQMSVGGSLSTWYILGVYRYDEEETGIVSLTAASDEVITTMYVPLGTAKAVNGSDAGYQSFTVVGGTVEDQELFISETERFFASYYTRNDSYTVETSSLSSLLETMTEMLGTVQLAISAIAAISLLVGGIGVMNIMLVSITERTREIGIRKALGAPGSAIRLQFIVEAVVICLIGGLLGVAVGVGLGAVAADLMGFPARASVESILLAVGFSMGIGLFFGYYPANKAAKLDPIEALRYE
ncbi:MAG: ABC transporter permease [Oscillospiraceae bacterium]|nr:ABC transporter permease [Oscillospiraceae bacterium]